MIKLINTKIVPWLKAIILLICGAIPALAIIEYSYVQPLFYLLILIYVPIAQFAFTPFFTLLGVYTYYSPMLLAYMVNEKEIDLHSGTSFDYLLVMRKYRPGIEMRNSLLMFYLDGLLNIVGQIEDKNIPETASIFGTSYFFNERTLKKMRFNMVEPSFFYRLNLFVNFVDLTWMYSVSQGRFSIPKLWRAKKAFVTGAKLLEHKRQIEALYKILNSKTSQK